MIEISPRRLLPRLAVPVAVLLLAGCAQGITPPPGPAAMTSPPPAAPPPPPSPAPGPMSRTGRQQIPPPPPAADAEPAEPMTREKASAQCWMSAETDRKAPRELEARAKWVGVCMEAKLKNQPR